MAPGNKRPFPFVHSVIDRHGHRRHYFRRSGYKRVTLPGAWGSAEFQDAYRKALAGEIAPKIEIGAGRSKPGSVAALVALYLGSMDFGGLAHATQRDRRLILERFRETYGERSFGARAGTSNQWSPQKLPLHLRRGVSLRPYGPSSPSRAARGFVMMIQPKEFASRCAQPPAFGLGPKTISRDLRRFIR